MEDNSTHTLPVESIRNDLNRIMDEWLHLHFRLTMVLVAIAFLVEVSMAFYIVGSDILTTTIPWYIIKFIVAPSGVSALLLVIAHYLIRSESLSQKTKQYVVSLLFVAICCIYYTAHCAFLPIFALYTVAIFLTTTYADYKLTSVTSVLALITLTISELFIFWDQDKISVFVNSSRMVNFLVVVSILIGCSIVASVTIHYERRKNEASLRREVERELLKESMLFDELTGVYNRKALHSEMRLMEQTAPTEPLVFCITDIDHFKSVNDLYGHQVGDLCLMEFACVLSDYFGESSVFRYGGDEFCLILKNMTIEEAKLLCERAQIRIRRIDLEGVTSFRPTACFGLTAYNESDGVTRLFNQADEALYDAKRTRNAIRVYQRSVRPVGSFRILSQEDSTK
jgi:diguanylate cyclase (GGDEF) domain